MINKWRFPASNHGERKGISSGDTETFKKAPYEAFAREILQNSIDARKSDEDPTRVEFSIFEIKTKNIPGYQELKDSLRRCREFWAHKEDYVAEFKEREKVLEESTIKCLRVSDFNTTGLIGVESTEQKGNQFLALTKGTGVSEKTGAVAGGSKGVGKNAAFLMSSINTVFYSTRTCYDINKNPGTFTGSIGVADLESGYLDDVIVENRDYTQGKGYYSTDDLNNASNELLNLDPKFNNRINEYGTDIYILGFTEGPNWDKEIINSILNSFMATIVRGELEVIFNGNLIDKDSVAEFVFNDSIIFKNNKANIISQYRLLKNIGDVKVYPVDTEYGSCNLLILPYSKEEENLAIHKCAMIRYPLMKIKDIDLGASFRVSAMCIINDDSLGKALRQIENPQHIDWEPKRIKNLSERKEMQNVLKDIREQINKAVIECLQLGDTNPLDPNGAGDFLPDEDLGDGKEDKSGDTTPAENVTVSKVKENKTSEKNANKEDETGQGLVPDIGSADDGEDGDVEHPTGTNGGQGGGSHSGEETGKEKEGESIVFERKRLSGVRYKVIALNKTGKLRVIFKAPIDFEKCYLNIQLLDDSNNKVNVEINSMSCNGVEVSCTDKNEFGPFQIHTNEKIVLDVDTNNNGYFASEVKVICK